MCDLVKLSLKPNNCSVKHHNLRNLHWIASLNVRGYGSITFGLIYNRLLEIYNRLLETTISTIGVKELKRAPMMANTTVQVGIKLRVMRHKMIGRYGSKVNHLIRKQSEYSSNTFIQTLYSWLLLYHNNHKTKLFVNVFCVLHPFVPNQIGLKASLKALSCKSFLR